MAPEQEADPPPIQAALLKPYASVIVLMSVDVEPDVAFAQLSKFLKSARRLSRSKTAISVVASGLDEPHTMISNDDGEGFDDVEIDVHRIEAKPGWLKESLLVDVRHELTLAVRKSRLIAVHASGPVRDSLQRWLDKPPRPHLQRLSTDIFEEALLQGESKGLWLRGTHARRSTKADSKTITGPDLKLVLTTFDDATFAMGSARSALQDSPLRLALKGTVGTTPQRSFVWNRSTDSLDEFFQCVTELLALLETTIASRAKLIS